MNTYAVYLWPRGSLASELGSDTLFGAVCWAIRVLGLADVGELLRGFNARPRFAFSAAFPVYRLKKDDGVTAVRFYPRPLLSDLSPWQVDALAREHAEQRRLSLKAAKVQVVERAKRLKDVVYLSEALFTEVVRGQADTESLWRRFVESGSRPQDIERVGDALISYDERRRLQRDGTLEPFIADQAVQHNQVDRVAGATAEGLLFFEEETFFRAGGGLWCVLRADAEAVEQLIRPAFRYLADTGLGANRTVGKGHFAIEIEALALPEADAPNAFITLSRYLPQDGEWPPAGEPLRYKLLNLWPKREQKFAEIVPGQRTPPVRKRRVRMFVPGSIFPLAERRPLYGRLAEVVSAHDNGHTVWQSGLAVPVLAHIVNGGAP